VSYHEYIVVLALKNTFDVFEIAVHRFCTAKVKAKSERVRAKILYLRDTKENVEKRERGCHKICGTIN